MNFCAVALALDELGYKPIGIRIDSCDLVHISKRANAFFNAMSVYCNRPFFNELNIVAAGDINEETLYSLNEQGHKIDSFGVGTSLVTCHRQPSLGVVCKMVEINNQARIKLSQEVGKVTIPGRKIVYRLYGEDGLALVDLMQKADEAPPLIAQRVLCRHPFEETKRAFVAPDKVEALLKPYWLNGKICQKLPSYEDIRKTVKNNLECIRGDIKRNLNPTPYKVNFFVV